MGERCRDFAQSRGRKTLAQKALQRAFKASSPAGIVVVDRLAAVGIAAAATRVAGPHAVVVGVESSVVEEAGAGACVDVPCKGKVALVRDFDLVGGRSGRAAPGQVGP